MLKRKCKFKVGDKVRVIDDQISLRKGTEHIVKSVCDENDGIGVSNIQDGLTWEWYSYHFELVERNGVPVKAKQQGAKFDTGKLLFRALTRGLALPLKAVAAVLTYGAQKYAEDSWQQVPDAKARYESALDRHLNAWKSGETFDEESGLPHIAHAACNILFLLWFEIRDNFGQGLDTVDYTKFNTPPTK